MRRLGAAILSPLRPRFDNNDQPQSSGRQSSRLLQTPVYTSISGQAYEPNEAPEDFARDAKIELMRRATDDLKSASLDSERCQLLNDILDIMNTEPDTRDVFREMDGFLVTLNVLSSLKPPSSLQNDDIVRCIFSVLAQAVDNHRGNTATLQALIGDLVLYGTLETLVSTNATSVTHVLGCLLAFSVNDFALADLFNTIESGSDETKVLGSMNIHSVVVQNVTGIATTLRFLHLATHSTVHAALKLLDRLVHSSHRNQALLNASGIVGLLFHFLRTGPPYISESGIVSIKKSLKRLLEMGAPVEEARIIFKSFLNSVDTPTGKSYTLDPTSLDLIKNGMKFASKWPSFIAFGTGRHNRAGIDMSECQLNGRTFPGSAGFTYLAWIYIEKLPTDNSELQLLHAESTGWPPRTLCTLKVLPSGLLSYYTPSMREPTVLEPLPQQPSTPIPITVPLNVHILPPAVGTASPHPGSTSLPTRRWIQVTLVHHAIRAAHNVRVFLDGILFATATSPYPKTSPPPVSLFIGIDSPHPLAPPPPQPSASPLLGNRLNIFGGGSRPRTPVSETRQDLPPPNFSSMPTADLQDALSDKSSGPMWFLASSHLLLQSIPNELPRLFFTLGPAYTGNFQDALSKFLTYKASTSLHIGIQNQNHHHSQEGLNSLNKALSEGIELKESHIAYSISPHGIIEDGHGQQLLVNSSRERKIKEVKLGEMIGSARTIKIAPLHSAVWNFGGAAVLLRLVQLASSEQELASAVSILADAVNASWQLSDEMERSHGYIIFMAMLRSKSSLVNSEVFHILLEFLGVDFATHENSTITNYTAYRSIALDFSFWALLPPPLQRLHLSHFDMILLTSKFRHFNTKFRFIKLGAIKKLLFALQTRMYRDEMVPEVISALAGIARQSFSTDATIKPIVSFLAANLERHEADGSIDTGAMSVSGTGSPVGTPAMKERAEQVLEAFINILSSDAHMIKFKSALPAPRVCLLLLGSQPTSTVAAQILNLVGSMIGKDSSFPRKLELVSFWTILKEVLPRAWDSTVHVAAFDVLFGRASTNSTPLLSGTSTVVCAHVFPSILATLDHGLKSMLQSEPASEESESRLASPLTVDSYVEVLAEELIELHSSSPSFRSLLHSKPMLSIYIKSARSFVMDVSQLDSAPSRITRISEKITHLALICALDQSVDVQQREELMQVMKMSHHHHSAAETVQGSENSRPISSLLSRSMTFRQSLRLDSTLSIDRSYLKALDRSNTWRKLIKSSEQKRLRKAQQDHREYIRSLHRPIEWQEQLHSERGLWSETQDQRMWRLDETEGPARIRKKLQPARSGFNMTSGADTSGRRDAVSLEVETQSIVQPDAPPWQESYEYDSMTSEDDRLMEDTGDDKNRRVRHELEPGDVVEEVRTVTRVVGVDASPGLLLVGRSHIYMMDGLVQDQDGDIIDARDAPKDVLSVPGTVLALDGRQTAQRWPIDQVSAFSKRSYLFRDVALEIYFRDSRSILVVFSNKQDRHTILGRLNATSVQVLGDLTLVTPSKTGNFRNVVGQRLPMSFLASDEIGVAQRRWQNREISNYTYISLINQASGRTPNDLTQYPVFPWVLSDYTSPNLELTSSDAFRDLSKPIGALTQLKREAAEMRYSSLEQVEETPFHYGTHFSSSMIVAHFLIRLSPFSHYFKTLQGGDWDLPDRLFSDIKRAWDSASNDSRGDVRELIPEFYTCPEFLENLSRLDFGVQTSSSQKIDSVGLPPWAKQDPWLFIDLHRQALESDYVSKNLPAWIDLVWGCKQRDKVALNVFHPLSYEGAIDLDSITDDLQKEATAGIIHNFGQTPRKLFSNPHPPRHVNARMYLPVGESFGIPEDCHLLLQSPNPVCVIDGPVSYLSVDPTTGSPLPCRDRIKFVPLHPNVQVEWGAWDQTLRLYVGGKLTQVVEAASVTCCDFVDQETLITGLEDTTVCLWRLMPGQGKSLHRTHVMRGHSKAAVCLATSRVWSAVLTGSADCTAILWDLNRGRYVRSIHHDSSVTACAIQESSGCIATSSRNLLQIHTINGHLITSIRLSAQGNIRCLAFHERDYTPIPVLAAGCLDGSIVLRTWNASSTPVGQKACWEFSTLRVLRCRKEDRTQPGIECLKFHGESFYHGDNLGNVYLWNGE